MKCDRFAKRDLLVGFPSTVTFGREDGPLWKVRGYPGVAARLHWDSTLLVGDARFTVRRKSRAVEFPTDERTLTLVPRMRGKGQLHQPFVTVRLLGFGGSPDVRSCTAVMSTLIERISDTDPQSSSLSDGAGSRMRPVLGV